MAKKQVKKIKTQVSFKEAIFFSIGNKNKRNYKWILEFLIFAMPPILSFLIIFLRYFKHILLFEWMNKCDYILNYILGIIIFIQIEVILKNLIENTISKINSKSIKQIEDISPINVLPNRKTFINDIVIYLFPIIFFIFIREYTKTFYDAISEVGQYFSLFSTGCLFYLEKAKKIRLLKKREKNNNT